MYTKGLTVYTQYLTCPLRSSNTSTFRSSPSLVVAPKYLIVQVSQDTCSRSAAAGYLCRRTPCPFLPGLHSPTRSCAPAAPALCLLYPSNTAAPSCFCTRVPAFARAFLCLEGCFPWIPTRSSLTSELTLHLLSKATFDPSI